MPIDASIYAQLQPAKLATIGEIMEARGQQEDREMVRESRRQSVQKQQRDAAEQQEVESAFRDLSGPDGPDQKAILARLYKTAPSAASKVDEHFTTMRKNATADKKAQLESETARAQAVTRHLQGVTPQTYAGAIARIRRFDPDAAAELGEQFDPARVDAVVNAGLQWSEYNTKYKTALEQDEKDLAKVLNVMALADDPKRWTDAWEMGQVLGVSSELRQMGLSDQFQPDAPAKAGQLTMNAKDRAALTEQAADNARQDKAQQQTQAYQNAQLGISRGQLAVAQGNLAARKAESTGASGSGESSLVDAIMKNPSAYDDLTPTVKTKLIGALADRGFDFKKAGATAKAGPDAARIFGEIDTLSKRINTTEGGIGSVATGWARRGAAKAQYDNDVSEFEALVSGMIPMVARAVGHTGVLTQQDVDSVRALFPKTGDNKTLAQNKLARVTRILGTGGSSDTKKLTAEELIQKYGGGR